MSTYTYYLPDIKGPCCVGTVLGAFDQHELLKHGTFEVDVLEKTLTLYCNDDIPLFKNIKPGELNKRVKSALDAVGFDAKPKSISHTLMAAMGLIAGFALLVLPFVVPLLPWVAAAGLAALSVALTVGLGFPFYRRAYYALKQGKSTMDTLFSISTGIVLAVSVAALFVPALPMMFEAGLLIFGFRHAGIAISDAFKAQLVGVRRLQDDAPEIVKCNGRLISLQSVKPGDVLEISPGDILPVDGVFESGAGLISNTYKTGSSEPSELRLNQTYDAGTKLLQISEPLSFRVKAKALDSFLAREDKQIRAAKLKQKPSEKGLYQVLRWFVPTVIAVAIASAIIVGAVFASWVLALQTMVCVMVAACPCTLGLIVPLVTHVGLKKAEKAGVIFRDVDKLSEVDAVDAVMFDLNGTLTSGTPYVKNPEHNQELLQTMAHLEGDAEHWVANAIKLAVDNPITDTQGQIIKSDRYGLEVKYKKDTYHLGSRTMMDGLNIPSDKLDVALGLGETTVYLAKNGKLVGHVVLADTIRTGAHEVVHALQTKLDKSVYLCTGSDVQTANLYAKALNIPSSQVFSACTIQDKKAHLKQLQGENKRILFVGDAGNDGLVISESDVGIVVAHEGGHEGAQQGASAVLHSKSLKPLLDTFEIARKTVSNIKQNTGFSFIYNACAMLLPMVLVCALGFALNPAVGAGLMMLQTLLIFANVHRFSTEKGPEEEKASISKDFDRDIGSVSNRVGLTHTHFNGFNAECCLDTGSNGFGDSLNETEGLRPS